MGRRDPHGEVGHGVIVDVRRRGVVRVHDDAETVTARVLPRDARAGEPPPPPEPPAEGGGVRGFFAKMAFWKKVEDGDASEAVAARTAELARRDGDGGEEGGGKPAPA